MGVDVIVGGGVLDGSAVCDGALVARGCVTDGVINPSVGVAVGVLDGKLQADRAKARITLNKLRNFIPLLLLIGTLSYTKTWKKAILH